MKSFLLVSCVIYTFCQQYNNTITEHKFEKMLQKLNKTMQEKEALKILNELVYQNFTFTSLDFFRDIYKRNWLQASQLILDFMLDVDQTEAQNEMSHLTEHLTNNTKEMRGWLASKKKNIIRISPIFEWSQDNEEVKIRLKFSKNLESPGEIDIKKFQVNCTRTHLLVQGYKIREEYVAYYYRYLALYDYILPYTCKASKETDGTYIIKFKKGQNTLIWNFLDQITGDHYNTYTWIELYSTFENKAKYYQFRDWAGDNQLEADLDYHVKEKMEEKIVRMKKIENIYNFIKTKTYERKNYCFSPINDKYCYLPNYFEWSYWMF
jgi:hypothetical protein